MRKFLPILIIMTFLISANGCAMFKKKKKLEGSNELAELQQQLSQKDDELAQKNAEIERLKSEKDKQISELENAKNKLMKDLQKEIGEYKAKLEMTERGLVLTFLAEVFFDAGKAEIKESSFGALQSVAEVLKQDVPDTNIIIEGHTDADPIKHSGWKSNWELSTARSLGVLHYFIDECGLNPARLSSAGFGEYKPVASNDTKEGKKQNRRVEIVIIPQELPKVKIK